MDNSTHYCFDENYNYLYNGDCRWENNLICGKHQVSWFFSSYKLTVMNLWQSRLNYCHVCIFQKGKVESSWSEGAVSRICKRGILIQSLKLPEVIVCSVSSLPCQNWLMCQYFEVGSSLWALPFSCTSLSLFLLFPFLKLKHQVLVLGPTLKFVGKFGRKTILLSYMSVKNTFCSSSLFWIQSMCLCLETGVPGGCPVRGQQQVYCHWGPDWSFLLTWCGFSHNAVFSILSSHRAEVPAVLWFISGS